MARMDEVYVGLVEYKGAQDLCRNAMQNKSPETEMAAFQGLLGPVDAVHAMYTFSKDLESKCFALLVTLLTSVFTWFALSPLSYHFLLFPPSSPISPLVFLSLVSPFLTPPLHSSLSHAFLSLVSLLPPSVFSRLSFSRDTNVHSNECTSPSFSPPRHLQKTPRHHHKLPNHIHATKQRQRCRSHRPTSTG